jgi:hypothetical protein
MASGALGRFGAWLRKGEEVGPDEVVRLPVGDDVPRAQAILAACREAGLNVQPEYVTAGAYATLAQEQRLLVMGRDLAAVRRIVADH